jgi:hypothetical protein
MRQLQRERRHRSVPGRDEATIVYGAATSETFFLRTRRFLACVERDKAARVHRMIVARCGDGLPNDCNRESIWS